MSRPWPSNRGRFAKRKKKLLFAEPLLDKLESRQYNLNGYGLVAQLGAHHIRIVGGGSSNLLKSTNQKIPP